MILTAPRADCPTVSSAGEEAIIPKTQAQATGIFLVEQKDWTEWIVSGGVRIERETRRPEGGLRARDFNLSTVSGGVVWKFAPRFNFSVNLTQAQRAPGIEELYSQGAHGATATFDIGDAGLSKEISRNLGLTLRKTAGVVKWKINLFANRFSNYVFAKSVK